MYTYPCEIARVVDGDTVDVNIDLGFGVCTILGNTYFLKICARAY